MKKGLQIFLALFGLTDIFIALLHQIYGPSAIPGSVPVNATMDSEDRFYATLFLAYGVVCLWCIRDLEKKSNVVYFLAATFFAGGIARLISYAAVGPPVPFFIAMTALELIIPPGMVLAQMKLARSVNGAGAARP